MAYLYRRINTDTGLEECVSSVSTKAFEEATFQVIAPAGISEVSLLGYATLTASSAVVVTRNGQDLFEGGLRDFTQDVVNNKILFNYTVPYRSLIKVRVYSEQPQEGVYIVVGYPGVSELPLGGYVTLANKDKIAVLRNGQDLVEGSSSDFTRDVPNNKILFNYLVPMNSVLKVRAF